MNCYTAILLLILKVYTSITCESFIHVLLYFMVSFFEKTKLLFLLLIFKPFTGPILEFKESIQHVQKGYPTLLTQVDMIP